MIRGSSARSNLTGIAAQGNGALIEGSTSIGNSSFGLSMSAATHGYAQNVIHGNSDAAVVGGTNLGSNLCDGVICP